MANATKQPKGGGKKKSVNIPKGSKSDLQQGFKKGGKQ